MVQLGRWAVMNVTGRRCIYLGMLLAVTVPMIWRISFKEHPTPMVRDIFATIEKLPKNARVLFVCDFDPASAAETRPMEDAFARHLCLRGVGLYCLTLWPTGPIEIDRTIRDVIALEFPSYRYGQNFVNLGYMSGNEAVVAVALTNFKKAFSTDVHNISTHDASRLPMMVPIEDLASFDLIVDVSAGYPGLNEWIPYGAIPAGVPIVGGSVAVGSPEIFPYIPEQCGGILVGVKGAAEYEQLLLEQYPQLDRPECRIALERMGPQTVAHLMIIGLILLGNGIHLWRRHKEAAA